MYSREFDNFVFKDCELNRLTFTENRSEMFDFVIELRRLCMSLSFSTDIVNEFHRVILPLLQNVDKLGRGLLHPTTIKINQDSFYTI